MGAYRIDGWGGRRELGRIIGRFLVVGCAMVLTAGLGCTSAARNEDLQARVDAAVTAFGNPFSYFYVSSDGALEDSAFITMSNLQGESAMARELAGLMGAGQQAEIRVMVSGPSREKTERVILDAVALSEGKRLEGLHFLFLGNSSYEAKIGAAIESLGAKFSFAAY